MIRSLTVDPDQLLSPGGDPDRGGREIDASFQICFGPSFLDFLHCRNVPRWVCPNSMWKMWKFFLGKGEVVSCAVPCLSKEV